MTTVFLTVCSNNKLIVVYYHYPECPALPDSHIYKLVGKALPITAPLTQLHPPLSMDQLLPTQVPGMCPAPAPAHQRECQASGRRKRSVIPSALLPKHCSLNCVIKQIISTRRWEFFYSNWATAGELQDPAQPGRAG